MSVDYRVQVFDFDGTSSFGIGDLLAEFENAKNLGYADYANDVPESFFTVNQDDPKLALVAGKEGMAHVRILRDDEVVHAGFFGLETDEDADDVVFYNYGYAAALFWLQTDWGQEWVAQTLGTIASDLWTRAKTTLTYSNLGFVTTGTIQDPPTVKGGGTAMTLPLYTAYWKRILFVLREMTAIAASDVGNVTLFEITHSATPTFNFWKDRGTDVADALWVYGPEGAGSGNIQGFRNLKLPVFQRSDLLVAGATPHNVAMRTEKSDSSLMTSIGRRAEPIFFSWARDEDEVDRGANIRAAKAYRTQQQTMLSFRRNAIAPIGTTDSPVQIGDSAHVIINRGRTQIDGYRQITGSQTVFSDGQEKVNAIIQVKP